MHNPLHHRPKGARSPHLTPRQKEVLTLTRDGFRDADIATILDISPETVARHLYNASLILEAENRIHLVVEAIRRGLIPLTDTPAPTPRP